MDNKAVQIEMFLKADRNTSCMRSAPNLRCAKLSSFLPYLLRVPWTLFLYDKILPVSITEPSPTLLKYD